jgi:1,2-phenylacetyl-CoA epoxidase catalytic subunit
MNDKTITFKRGKTETSEIYKWHREGYRIVCPLCKSEIVFQESGSWCPKNPNHYEVHAYSKKAADVIGNGRQERLKQESIENMKKKGYSQSQIQEHLDKYYPQSN